MQGKTPDTLREVVWWFQQCSEECLRRQRNNQVFRSIKMRFSQLTQTKTCFLKVCLICMLVLEVHLLMLICSHECTSALCDI